jgi:hypothetical protein
MNKESNYDKGNNKSGEFKVKIKVIAQIRDNKSNGNNGKNKKEIPKVCLLLLRKK